jgi:pyruvoyl-dependent arginine decarboxylase (PvlArgDC)
VPIPKEYFWVIGWGESDVGIESGSYDAALHMAGIENYNVMLYTSVLPPETVELVHLPDIHHGSVLEGIIAVQHTESQEHGLPPACLWPRSIAIQISLIWAVLLVNMLEMGRLKKRKPI